MIIRQIKAPPLKFICILKKRDTISRKHRANLTIFSAVSKKRASALIFSRSLRVFIVLASDK